jgi:hypothetical protein
MKTSACPGCGASVAPTAERCPYCQLYFVREAADVEAQRVATAGATAEACLGAILFRRASEPNENAFSLAVPHGWLLEGGIFRADLTRQVIDAQSIEAKLDFALKRDAAGSVMIRWCPEIKYCDMRMSPAGMMGFFPPGSTVQGMTVSPLMSARDFLIHVVFPWAHPQAGQVRVTAQENQPLLCQRYQQRMAALGTPADFHYDGGMVSFTYVENGIHFEETAQSVIENMGAIAGGMWSNKDTVIVRAPEGELCAWQPILRHVQESIQINPQWLAQEIVNQEFLSRSFLNAQQASIARDRRMLEIQQEIQRMDREIVQHRMQTNAEIMNDNYLTLMELEEYVNPYTSEPEIGSNQWDYRWVTESGEEFYTDNGDHDPNIASVLNRTDWKRTPIRPRFPQEV